MKAELWEKGAGITITRLDPLIHSTVIQIHIAGMHTKGFDVSKLDDLKKLITEKIVAAINQSQEKDGAE